jgi:hypothetical protein
MNLAVDDIELLMESVQYSKQRVAEAQETPYAVCQAKVDRLDSVRGKLSEMKNNMTGK